MCSPKRSSSFPRRSPDPSVSTAADRALARRADCARDASRSHVGASGYTAGYDVPQDSRSIAADDRPGPGVPRPAPGSRDRGGRDACRTVPRRCVRGGARRADRGRDPGGDHVSGVGRDLRRGRASRGDAPVVRASGRAAGLAHRAGLLGDRHHRRRLPLQQGQAVRHDRVSRGGPGRRPAGPGRGAPACAAARDGVVPGRSVARRFGEAEWACRARSSGRLGHHRASRRRRVGAARHRRDAGRRFTVRASVEARGVRFLPSPRPHGGRRRPRCGCVGLQAGGRESSERAPRAHAFRALHRDRPSRIPPVLLRAGRHGEALRGRARPSGLRDAARALPHLRQAQAGVAPSAPV